MLKPYFFLLLILPNLLYAQEKQDSTVKEIIQSAKGTPHPDSLIKISDFKSSDESKIMIDGIPFDDLNLREEDLVKLGCSKSFYKLNQYGLQEKHIHTDSDLPGRTTNYSAKHQYIGDHAFGFLPIQFANEQGSRVEEFTPAYLAKPQQESYFLSTPLTRLGFGLRSTGAQEFQVQHSRLINQSLGFEIRTQSQSSPGMYANSAARFGHFGGKLFANGLFPRHRFIFEFDRDTIGQNFPGFITDDITQIPNPRSAFNTSDLDTKSEYLTSSIQLHQYYQLGKADTISLNDSTSDIQYNGLSISAHTKYQKNTQSTTINIDSLISISKGHYQFQQKVGLYFLSEYLLMEGAAFYENRSYGFNNQLFQTNSIHNTGISGFIDFNLIRNLDLQGELEIVLAGSQVGRFSNSFSAQYYLGKGNRIQLKGNLQFIPRAGSYYSPNATVIIDPDQNWHTSQIEFGYSLNRLNFQLNPSISFQSFQQFYFINGIEDFELYTDINEIQDGGTQQFIEIKNRIEKNWSKITISNTSSYFLTAPFQNSIEFDESMPQFGTSTSVGYKFNNITTLSNIELGLRHQTSSSYTPSIFVPGLQEYGYGTPGIGQINGIQSIGMYLNFKLNMVRFELFAQNIEDGLIQQGVYQYFRTPGPYREFGLKVEWDFMD